MITRRTAAITIGGIAMTTVLALTGCAPSVGGGSTDSGSSSAPVSQADIDKAMDTETTLTLWSWVPDLQNQVDLFEKKYPKIKVNLVNTTGGAQHYPKLRSALKAGKGVPDVAQVEFQFIPSFVQTKSLADLTPYGAADQKSGYVDWVWNQVASNGAVWAVPQDSGPLGSLYRKDIFDKAGVTEAPKTWAEFADAAKAVKDKTDSYITNLPGNDAGQMYGFFWQAGAKPFSYDGKKTVGIDVDSPDTQKVVDYWQKLIDDDLVSTDPDFTDEYYQGLARDKYASWQVAAWGPVFLQGTAKNTSGKWRAGTIPQWTEGANVSGNWGGSTDAVMSASTHKIAAYELAKFINTDKEAALKLANEQFLFPTTTAILEDPEFTGQKSEFYGGQEVNKFFAGVSDTVDKDFQWLPFMDYVGSSYGETLGTAIAEKGNLRAALTKWQSELETYAKQQGFTVK
jgi:multiple sugar transport system substrate-binding protein